ncbi:hypothetical protein BH20ACI1_BH20ACI1_20900 [soil metagenome]
MKQCPNCQTKYTDDTLKFCLQDGTPLISPANPETEMPTVAFTDSERLSSPRQVERLDIPVENSRDWQPSQETQVSAFEPESKKPNTFFIVALTAIVTLLLFGGAVGTWFYLKNRKTEVVQNNNNKGAVNQKVIPQENLNKEVSPSPTVEESSPSPTSTPTATPAPNFNPEQLKREVSEKINAWKRAAEAVNLNGYMNYYADTIDYYNKKGASLETVRKDKQKAFSKFYNIEINLSNLRVTPDASGMRAVAVFDKEWNFEGDESYSAGKVQTQLQLRKFDGRWLITGEKDLKVYYTE